MAEMVTNAARALMEGGNGAMRGGGFAATAMLNSLLLLVVYVALMVLTAWIGMVLWNAVLVPLVPNVRKIGSVWYFLGLMVLVRILVPCL
jgi:hypothetical protein